ncbi:MAG: polysaccharide biosynthesis tyrosine autokinase [Planctomycetota bacterium]|nr:polysaccharide biosynthesis tyrosine autokinase [Planctomycetota bacterium]
MTHSLPRPESETFESQGLSNYVDLLDLVRIGWRRKSLIALGTVVGLVLGSLYYVRSIPLYSSEAQILVVKKRPDVVTGEAMRMSHFEDYVTTHRILIRSPLIVERAVKQANLQALKSFVNEEGDLTDAIIAKLAVERASKESDGNPNSVLRLSFRGTVPSECGTVVNAVLDSYKAFLDETYRNMSDDTVDLITEARDVLDNDLTKKETTYREFREKSPMIWKGKEAVNPRQERLTQIESQRSALLLRRAEFEGQLATIENAQAASRSYEELVALVSDLSGKADSSHPDRNASSTLKNQLLPLLLEEQTLLENYGPNHSQVLAVRQRIAATRNFFALPSAAYSRAADGPGKTRDSMTSDLVETYVQYLRLELDRIQTYEQVLSELFESEHETARELTSYEIQDADFRNSITRTQVLYDGLVKRLQEASMIKDYGGFDARIIAPAGMGRKVSPNALLTFPASAFLGVLAGIGLAYLAEIMDKSFRTPEEIRRRLGLPVVGHIPLLTVDQAARDRAASNGALDPMLFAYYQPRSAGAEAYRAIRTALYFSSVGEGHKVIQVTSPNPGDGKSTVTANVAVSIAQSGKRTLLIDADLRKPRQHKIFGVSPRVGLASVIARDAELADAIQDSQIRNLWILPCGPLPPDPAELLTSPRFPELLNLLRDQYDYVLVDSAPLLPVTDASVVAPRVDGVLLTVRLSKHGRPTAERAKEILNTLDATALGVVVNGVESGGAGGYGYGYGYGYGDGYGDGDENADDIHKEDFDRALALHGQEE